MEWKMKKGMKGARELNFTFFLCTEYWSAVHVDSASMSYFLSMYVYECHDRDPMIFILALLAKGSKRGCGDHSGPVKQIYHSTAQTKLPVPTAHKLKFKFRSIVQASIHMCFDALRRNHLFILHLVQVGQPIQLNVLY